MQYNPEELDEILTIFKSESEEIIQSLNDGFLLLEKNPEDKAPLKKLFQLSHSLKGAARMLGFNSIQDIAHKLEDILSFWKKDDVVINVDVFQEIYEVCDLLLLLVSRCVEQKSNYSDAQVMSFIDKLEKLYPSIEYVNRLMTHSWGQRVIRFYDLDGNLIEVGTPMESLDSNLQG